MISNEQLIRQLMAHDDIQHVDVSGDGYHYRIVIVSNRFEGKTKVARQQWVYKVLNDYIVSGELHAVNMQTWTVAEWEKQHG